MTQTTLDPRFAQCLFVAGTDTGVGKTHVSLRLIQTLRNAGHEVAGMKPVAAGAVRTSEGLRNEDALALQAAATRPLPYAWVNPCCFERATSPHLAAKSAGKIVDITLIKSAFDAIRSETELVIVEGAGGWLAPIGEPGQPGSRALTMADVALALNLPVLLVVGMRLGCLSQAQLSARAIRQDGLQLMGWYANAIEPDFADLQEYIQSMDALLDAPRLSLPDIHHP
jgi:dethiobiotin synthetase